jgi:hypothetical protein
MLGPNPQITGLRPADFLTPDILKFWPVVQSTGSGYRMV